MRGHLLSARKGPWNVGVFPKSHTVFLFVLFRSTSSFFNSVYCLKYSDTFSAQRIILMSVTANSSWWRKIWRMLVLCACNEIYLTQCLSSVYWVTGGRDSDWLRAGRSGDRIPVGARFFALVQTGPGTHPTSYTLGTGSFPGVKRLRRGANHSPLLASRSRELKLYHYTTLGFRVCYAVPLPLPLLSHYTSTCFGLANSPSSGGSNVYM
jgi:hypothetical protein